MTPKQNVSTCLHFRGTAEEAVNRYVELLPNSKVVSISRYVDDSIMPKGTAMLIRFELDDSSFWAINGPADWPFTEAISMVARCEDQAAIDRVWDGLLADGGGTMACGWLRDRFGVCWQVVPAQLEEWISGEDTERTTRVMHALYQMVKLDLAKLEAAAKG